MDITVATTVGEVAVQHPLATRVFARHGIDFCCGGGKTLEEACSSRGLDSARVLAEIETEVQESDAPPRRWDQEPVEAVIDHILTAYHAPLREELPRLEGLVKKVHQVHRDKAPEMLAGVLDTYLNLRMELDLHMAKEEEILFPMIRAGKGAMAEGPISMMEQEHDAAGGALVRLRELTHGYEVPEEACNSWRALWHGLAALETALHEHIHIENNVLFPRVLSR
jgi:regulator of cell morphogenesis and NO signaling